MDEEEKRRQGLGALIAQLKKYNKAQTRKEIDVEVCVYRERESE